MHQSTTPSLSQTIWARWASRQFFTVLTVQTLLPMTFGYSLSYRKNLEAVVMSQLRRWKRLWGSSLTRSYKRTSMGPWRSCWNGLVHCGRKRLLRRGLELHVCTINKSAHTKKSGNLFNEPCILSLAERTCNVFLYSFFVISNFFANNSQKRIDQALTLAFRSICI